MAAAPLNKVDIFMTDVSQYQVLHHFSQKFFEALKRAGFQTRLLTRNNREEILLKDPPQLTIAFNALSLQTGDDLICDALKIPHLTILVDPPHWGGVSVMNSPYIILGCDDHYGCTFLDNIKFHRHLFIPHAVEPDLDPGKDEDRVYDVVLLASYYDYEQEKSKWSNLYPDPLVQLMEESAELAFGDTDFSFIPIFLSNFYSQAQKYDLGGTPSDVFFDALQSLERYIKGRDRGLLLKSLKNVKVHVFGNSVSQGTSWKTYLGNDFPNIQVHEGVDFESAIEIMKKSKIVLNPSLKNKQGSHERFFTGTASGALVISSDSPYLREQFIENEEVILYNHSQLDALEPVVNFYLTREKNRKSVAERARHKVMKNHTWDARIKQIWPDLVDRLSTINK